MSNRAPSMLLDILERKLKYIGRCLNRVNTPLIKASQYNHVTNTYEKKKLHERWNDFGFYTIQRDLYSAFLLMNCKENLNEIDRNRCEQHFDTFRAMHDIEILRLKRKEKTPISMGI